MLIKIIDTKAMIASLAFTDGFKPDEASGESQLIVMQKRRNVICALTGR